MLVGWRAGYVATLGACAVGVVSLDACATVPVRQSPVIDGYLHATCVAAHRDPRVAPPVRSWDQTLQTRGAGAVRITGAQSVGGEIKIDFSSGAGDQLGVKSGDYVYPSDVRVDPIRDILYLRTYGLPAMSHEAVTWLFEVDLRKRVRTAGLEVDAAVLPPECAEVETPVQTSGVSVKPGAAARAIQRPGVDLAPPPPVPLLVLTWENGETPRRYSLEIDKDGTGRFLGEYNGCLTGEMTMEVPSATLEEARRIVLQSHVFDRPVRRCSSSLTDNPGFGIYFAEPPPGRKVSGELCREQRPVVKLARQLDRLLDLKGWIGTVEKCPR